MPSVVRTITRIQDADDFTGSLTDTYIPVYSTAQGKFVMTAQSGGGTPGGSTTQVQYNNAGAFAGDAGMTYDAANDALTVAGRVITPVIRPASDSTTAVKIQNAAGSSDVVTVDTTNRRLTVANRISIAEYDANSGLYMARQSDGLMHKILTLAGGNNVQIHGIGGGSLELYTGGTLRLSIGGSSDVTFSQAINTSAGYYKFPTNPGTPLSLYQTNRWSISAPYTNLDMALVSRVGFTFVVNGSTGGTTHFDAIRISEQGYLLVGQMTGTALLDVAASTTARSSVRIRSGTAPTTPNSGDLWFDGTNLKFFDGTVTRTITWS